MNKLRYLRESRELLQKDVAFALGISRSAYSNYENDLRCPDPEMLKRMARFFSSLSAKAKARTLEQLDFEIAMEKRSAADERNVLRVAEDAASYPDSHILKDSPHPFWGCFFIAQKRNFVLIFTAVKLFNEIYYDYMTQIMSCQTKILSLSFSHRLFLRESGHGTIGN